jgi:hypothetical protein
MKMDKEITTHVSELSDKTWKKREKSRWTYLGKPDGNDATCTLHTELYPEDPSAECCGSRGKYPERNENSTKKKE